MEKTNKMNEIYLSNLCGVVAHKVSCSRKYVRMVLVGKLGKYKNRDTELVKKIREEAAKIEEMFKQE